MWSPKGSSCCLFFECSERVSRELRNSSFYMFLEVASFHRHRLIVFCEEHGHVCIEYGFAQDHVFLFKHQLCTFQLSCV